MRGTREERLRALDERYPVWENDTLWTRFGKIAARCADRPFLIQDDVTVTYAQTEERVRRISRALRALGVRQGDHVAVMLRNSPEFVYLIFALARIGAVKVPVNMKMAVTEAEYVIRQSDCRFLILQTDVPDFDPDALAKIGPIVVLHGDGNPDGLPYRRMTWPEFLALADTVTEEETKAAECREPDSVSDIIYTSGSTTFPKGVMLTHDMLLRSSYGTCRTRLMEEGRRILVPLPLYHIMAYVEGLLALMWAGGTFVMTSRRLTADYAYDLMKRHRVNDIVAVPILIIRLLESPRFAHADLPDLHAGYWASNCPDWVWEAGARQFGITDITNGYGMTECGSTTTMTSPVDDPAENHRNMGRLKDAGCAGDGGHLLEIRLCDPDTGQDVPAGSVGELYCRGLTVTPGYYAAAEANRAAFTPDGWFRTGDFGTLDERGYFTFMGRKNDIYKINGENVSPHYVSGVLWKCPQITAAEAVGIRDERVGCFCAVFAECAGDDPAVRRQIEDYCRKNLAAFELPRYIIPSRSDTWPRTANGKIQPEKLRERAERCIRRAETSSGEKKKQGIRWIADEI